MKVNTVHNWLIFRVIVLGQPAEFYTYGTMNIYFLLTYLICTVLVTELFIPVYTKWKVTSIYEYLEARFSRSVRYLGTFMYIVQSILYIGASRISFWYGWYACYLNTFLTNLSHLVNHKSIIGAVALISITFVVPFRFF